MQDDSPAVASAVQPIWSVLEREGVIKLEGFATLCMPAILALNYLDLEALGPEHSPAAEASTGDGGAERAAQTERWADAFEGVQQEAREGAQQRSVCGRMLAALRDEFGSERYLAVARAAAQDALRFGNAVYDARADEPQILRQQLWTEEDAEGFIAFAWCGATWLCLRSCILTWCAQCAICNADGAVRVVGTSCGVPLRKISAPVRQRPRGGCRRDVAACDARRVAASRAQNSGWLVQEHTGAHSGQRLRDGPDAPAGAWAANKRPERALYSRRPEADLVDVSARSHLRGEAGGAMARRAKRNVHADAKWPKCRWPSWCCWQSSATEASGPQCLGGACIRVLGRTASRPCATFCQPSRINGGREGVVFMCM